VSQAYETQDRKPVDRADGRAYVWRCARCGRFLARIDRLDGVLEVYHKCGAMNRLAGTIDEGAHVDTGR
jgi:phage FluMu protein Com